MNDTLLMILIGLMSLTLLVLAWAVIGLLVVAKRELPKLQRQVSDINGRVVQVLDEVIPTLQGATHTLKEAERALHEAAETIENLHIVSDNIRHKLEVADAVGARVRRLPERTARVLGRLMHQGFKLGGRMLSQQLEKRQQARRRASIYDGATPLDTAHRRRIGAARRHSPNTTDSARPTAENAPAGEATTHTNHKEG
jgi:uncharacterized protein YoxC